MYTLYRRHEQDCRYRKLGVRQIKCSCPVWIDGHDEQGRRIRRSLKTRSWSHAQSRLASIEQGRTEPLKPPRQSPQLGAAVESYLADCMARKLAPASLVSYGNTLGYLTDYFPGAEVAAIDVAGLTSFRGDRHYTHRDGTERQCSPANSLKELQTLRSFFAFCKARKWCDENPAKQLKPPKVDRLPTLPFSQAEIEAMLEACTRIDNPNPREIPRARVRASALLLLLLYSGLRISDAIKLDRASLDMKSGKLLLRMMKTRVPLYIKLPRIALDALAAVPRESQYFFWSGTAKLSTAVGSARRTIDCVVKLAKVENGHPHRFRDTFSVTLLQNGVDLRTVQLLLGHQSIRTTEKHYAPFVAAMQQSLDDAVSKLQFASAPDQLAAHPRMNTDRDALGNSHRNLLPFSRPKRA